MLATFIKLVVHLFRFIQGGDNSCDRRHRSRVAKGNAKDCVTAPSHLQLIVTRRGRVGIVLATIILLAIFSRK